MDMHDDWMEPMIRDDTLCGDQCPSDGCSQNLTLDF